MPLLKVTLNDGTELTVDPGGPWSAREQVNWEEHFRQSFTAVYAAIGAEEKALADAKAENREAVPASAFRLTWVLWFAWSRLRPRVAARFETFLDDQLADYDFVPDPDPEPGATEEPAAGEAAEAGGLDPTVLAAISAPAP